jgi:hypothetical protein
MSGLNVIQKNLRILYKFCRPHTIKGKEVLVVCLSDALSCVLQYIALFSLYRMHVLITPWLYIFACKITTVCRYYPSVLYECHPRTDRVSRSNQSQTGAASHHRLVRIVVRECVYSWYKSNLRC